jgi:hypothetical protein
MTTKTAKKAKTPTRQEVCIDLPGESVQCWRSSDNITIKLRKHRDVFFDLSVKTGAIYTVEAGSDFYSPRDKKLLRKAKFKDGEKFNLWIGREFKGRLVLKSDGKIMGTYEVNQLDTKSYDADPKTKPEPLMVIMGQKPAPSSFMCTADDQFGITSTQQPFKLSFDPKLSALKDFGTEFNYHYSLDPPQVKEYVAVTEALPHEIQPQVLKQLESGVAVEGGPAQIFLEPEKGQPPSLLHTALGITADVLTSNAFKESTGYVQENFRALNQLTMRVRIEMRVKGKYRVVLKGLPVTKWVGQALGITKNAKPMHVNMPLGSEGSSFLDGGFGKSGKAGYGGFKRVMLTTAENFRSGLKIQIIGTVIDLIVDVNTVYFDEKGSKDLSEFLARAGVSIAKAGATAALGALLSSVLLSLATAGAVAVGAAAAPVIAVVAVVIAGYVIAATIVDKVDDTLEIKTGAANLAR